MLSLTVLHAHRATLPGDSAELAKPCNTHTQGYRIQRKCRDMGHCCMHTTDWPSQRKCRTRKALWCTHTGEPPPGSEEQRNIHIPGCPVLTLFWPHNRELPHMLIHQSSLPGVHSCPRGTPGIAHPYPDYNCPAKNIWHTVYTLLQDWERELFHLTHRNKHRKSNKMGREKNMTQMKG